MDLYNSYLELKAAEPAGSVAIETCPRSSKILVMAPHGGRIEPGTSELAAEIAANDLSLYTFTGRKAANNWNLHITSTRFDEPLAEQMLEACGVVLTVHGLADKHEEFLLVGGLYQELKVSIVSSINSIGLDARLADDGPFAAVNPNNICNRGRDKKGIQLEITRALRDRFLADAILRADFVSCIRSSLSGLV